METLEENDHNPDCAKISKKGPVGWRKKRGFSPNFSWCSVRQSRKAPRWQVVAPVGPRDGELLEGFDPDSRTGLTWVAVITLYRKACCPAGKAIQERLSDLVVAHRVRIVDPETGDSELEPSRLPAIREGEELFSSQPEIQDYLIRLEKRMELWNRYQSDACYVGDDGEIC